MAQNSLIMPEAPLTGASLVSSINNALESIATDFYGVIDPATIPGIKEKVVPGFTWTKSDTNIVKKRNATNTGWIDFLDLNNGEILTSPTLTNHGMRVYTSDDNFIVPAKTVWVTACGGGGGCWPKGELDNKGRGANAWGVIDYPITGLTIGERVPIRIGAAGESKEYYPTEGGSTRFGSYLVVPGGTKEHSEPKNVYPDIQNCLCERIVHRGTTYGSGAFTYTEIDDEGNNIRRLEPATTGILIVKW